MTEITAGKIKLNKTFRKMVRTMSERLHEVDLETRIKMMTEFVEYLLQQGMERLWIAAFVGKDSSTMFAEVIKDEEHEGELEKITYMLAAWGHAQCVMVANDSWAVVDEDVALSSDLSLHPNRKEGIMVDARDSFRHLGAFKLFTRSSDRIHFDEVLTIEPVEESWFDCIPLP